MSRYLYSNGGGVIGHMDNRDKYLYSQGGEVIAYWDHRHKYMYTQTGEVIRRSCRLLPPKIRGIGLSRHRLMEEKNLAFVLKDHNAVHEARAACDEEALRLSETKKKVNHLN